MRRGEIWLVDFGDPVGHEPARTRPAVMVSADETGMQGLPMVVPFTTTRRGYITHVEVWSELAEVSYAACEQLRVISTERLVHKIGTVDGIEMIRIENILRRLLKL